MTHPPQPIYSHEGYEPNPDPSDQARDDQDHMDDMIANDEEPTQ